MELFTSYSFTVDDINERATLHVHRSDGSSEEYRAYRYTKKGAQPYQRYCVSPPSREKVFFSHWVDAVDWITVTVLLRG